MRVDCFRNQSYLSALSAASAGEVAAGTVLLQRQAALSRNSLSSALSRSAVATECGFGRDSCLSIPLSTEMRASSRPDPCASGKSGEHGSTGSSRQQPGEEPVMS